MHATAIPISAAHWVARWARLVLGLGVFATGLALMLRANLGLSSWDVLHEAIRGLTPLTFGQAVIAVSVLVVVASLALGVNPGPGTVANVILVGAFTDVLLATRILDDLATTLYLLRLLALVAGIAAIAVGTALYVGADFGAGPRDSLMLAVAKWSRRSPGTARAAIEASVLVLGIALGGAAGVGTLVFAVLIGPAINISFRVLGMYVPPRSDTKVTRRIARASGNWFRRGQLGSASSTHASRYTGGRI
ncbi:MAG TPA: membrane protein [Actinomycetota bacterium]|nr:membrane protein [Actinomycetota bacterium]